MSVTLLWFAPLATQIQYEDFTKLCKETSQIINGCNLIQPQMLMERVISLREQSNQITEMGTGRYSISEQQIGKVTADTSTMEKSDAQRKVKSDEQKLEQCITKENWQTNILMLNWKQFNKILVLRSRG